MKETIKLRLIEELQKQLEFLTSMIDCSYKEWEEVKKQNKVELTLEKVNEIGTAIADTLCELEAEENEPLYMKGWRYLPPIANKQIQEMSNDKGTGECGNPLPMADSSLTSKLISNKARVEKSQDSN